MSGTWKLVAAWPIVATLLLAPGCGSKEGQNAGPATAGGEPPEAAVAGSAPAGVTPVSAERPGQDAQPAAAEPDLDSLYPVVRIETSLGNITVKLNAEKADMTVDNFLRYAESGFYNNTIFHQAFKDYVVIGGGYTPELVEKKTDGPIYNQASNGLKNIRGTIAMARKPDVIDSATCQFFFNVQDNPSLDHKSADVAEQYGYCVFGEVTQGMDVVDRIAAVPVHDLSDFESIPVDAVLIKSIRRVQ